MKLVIAFTCFAVFAIVLYGQEEIQIVLHKEIPGLAELQKMQARYAPTELKVETTHLSAGDKKALIKLLEAARVLDPLFMTQLYEGNNELYSKLKKDTTPLGRARLKYFWQNKGPWSDLDGHDAFLPDVPEGKPLGANFYPADMAKPEFERWSEGLSKEDKEKATGFYSVIQRDDASKKLTIVPYSQAYKADLTKAAGLLREAA